MLPGVLISEAASVESYQMIRKDDDSVLFRSANETVELAVFDDDIIHVTASPLKDIPSSNDYMVVADNEKDVPWNVDETPLSYVLSTDALQVKLSKSTGQVAFYDLEGNLISQEVVGSRSYEPAVEMGEETYHVGTAFWATQDKALYGLGGQQQGIVNYKGEDALLMQFNVIDVNTFVQSDRNYGILWNNDSITRFGDPRPFRHFDQDGIKVYDADGNLGGFTVQYYSDPMFKTLFKTDIDKKIDHEYLPYNSECPEGFNFANGSIRWTGSVEAVEAGEYKFDMFGASYVKLWIDGELLNDSWHQNWNTWSKVYKLDMKPGERHDIVLEWVTDSSYCAMKFLPPEPKDLNDQIRFTSEVGEKVDYYFVASDSSDGVVANYRELTGQAPMMPKWAFGKWQCRQRYTNQDQLLDVVREFRKRDIPLDNIVLDWQYWTLGTWGSHDFDKERYYDPEAMTKELHDDLHAHIMISVWPKFDAPHGDFKAKNFLEMKKKSFLYERNLDLEQQDWLGYVSTFYDAFNEDARDLFWKRVDEHIFQKGFDAWWLDATEPDVHSNITPLERKLRQGPTATGSAARNFNAFSMVHSQGVYEGQRKSAPNQRVFILTRSTYAGQQRYAAATWTGDVPARWEALKVQIPNGINFCAAGVPYWTTDIGGFSVENRFEVQFQNDYPNDYAAGLGGEGHRQTGHDKEEYRELFLRWYQFGAFCPLFRVHGEFPYREIYYIAPEGHPVYKSMLAYDKLRYALMPYTYSLGGAVTQDDYTIMRGLFMDFGYDETALNIDDEFMYGPAFLVAPVTDFKARSRDVYLPAGAGWYNFHTGAFSHGGRTVTASAPLTEIPLFVKAGSIVLFGPELQYVDEKPADKVEVRIYPGADASFTLYEDEGTTYDYEKGSFTEIPMTWDDETKTLTIGDREGSYEGMLEERDFSIVLATELHSDPKAQATAPAKIIHYTGKQLKIQL